MIAATSYGDPLAVFTAALVLFTLPSAYLAWVTVEDRKERRRHDEERAEERRLLTLIGSTFFGADRSKWPTPDQPGIPNVTSLVESMARQVKPRNGKTVAGTVEEIRDMVADQTNQVADLQKGMAAVSVLIAEHVSDGHGGQRSW